MSSPCSLVKTFQASLRHRIVAGGEKVRQRLENRHLRAQAPPHAAQFQTDHAGADHAQPLGHLAKASAPTLSQIRSLSTGTPGSCARGGAGGDDRRASPPPSRPRRCPTPRCDSVPRAPPCPTKRAVALQPGDLVLLEQHLDAAGQLVDDLVLARLHLRHVHLRAGHRDAVHGELVRHALVILRGLQQRLGGNAADVEAGAAERVFALVVLPLVDAGGRESRAAPRGSRPRSRRGRRR